MSALEGVWSSHGLDCTWVGQILNSFDLGIVCTDGDAETDVGTGSFE